MRSFKQLIDDFKIHLGENKPVREFLLLELSEEEFLFFKLMFGSAHIPQKYHEIQTDFLFWMSGYDFIDEQDKADEAYDKCCEEFYNHLDVVNKLFMGGYKLDGDSNNIDNYALINITPTSQELQEIVKS